MVLLYTGTVQANVFQTASVPLGRSERATSECQSLPLALRLRRPSSGFKQPAVPHGLAVLNRFLASLPQSSSWSINTSGRADSVERTVMKKRAKRTNTRCSLGAFSRLEICSRSHDVRFSGSSQNTRMRDSVSKAGQLQHGEDG
jgi:hypothetical protein